MDRVPDEIVTITQKVRIKKTDAELNDILHYRDAQTKAGNINEKFERHVLCATWLESTKENVWKYYSISNTMSRSVDFNCL